jgi:hypothetical protein
LIYLLKAGLRDRSKGDAPMSEIEVTHPATTRAMPGQPAAGVTGILVGGLIAGVIDIFVASAINHVGPGVILQAIASGLLGKASYRGGPTTIGLGLALQLGMSLIISAIYGLASARLPALVRRPLSFGALYGVGVFIVMSFIVMPLSAVYPKSHPAPVGVALQFAAMILFGLILTVTQSRLGARRR